MHRIDIESALGPMVLAAGPHGLAGAWFHEQRHFPTLALSWPQHRTTLLAKAEGEIKAYLAGQLTDLDLPLAPQGTPFQRTVWATLRIIPYGQSASYGQIARALGRPSAAGAGGGGGGAPRRGIVPCHRVVGSNGALTGYAGGLARKRWLLALEAGDAGNDRFRA